MNYKLITLLCEVYKNGILSIQFKRNATAPQDLKNNAISVKWELLKSILQNFLDYNKQPHFRGKILVGKKLVLSSDFRHYFPGNKSVASCKYTVSIQTYN
jgi:hypothetical protein